MKLLRHHLPSLPRPGDMDMGDEQRQLYDGLLPLARHSGEKTNVEQTTRTDVLLIARVNRCRGTSVAQAIELLMPRLLELPQSRQSVVPYSYSTHIWRYYGAVPGQPLTSLNDGDDIELAVRATTWCGKTNRTVAAC
jgi:hypothetical protein